MVVLEAGELLAGELTDLIRGEHLRSAILGDHRPHGLDAEIRGQGIGEPLGQPSRTCPVEDRTGIDEAGLHRNAGEIRRPRVVWAV